MHDQRIWIWGAIFALFVIFRILRAAFRGVAGAKNKDGMARLNAAAERILKERSGGANPLPRTGRPGAKPKPQGATLQASGPVLKVRSAPAVIRRGGLIAGGQEPVIQRRR